MLLCGFHVTSTISCNTVHMNAGAACLVFNSFGVCRLCCFICAVGCASLSLCVQCYSRATATIEACWFYCISTRYYVPFCIVAILLASFLCWNIVTPGVPLQYFLSQYALEQSDKCGTPDICIWYQIMGDVRIPQSWPYSALVFSVVLYYCDTSFGANKTWFGPCQISSFSAHLGLPCLHCIGCISTMQKRTRFSSGNSRYLS